MAVIAKFWPRSVEVRRSEVLDDFLFNSLDEAQEAADYWMTDYNEKRPHESLGNVPPTEYMPRFFNGRGL